MRFLYQLCVLLTLTLMSLTYTHASVFGNTDDEPLEVEQAFVFDALQVDDQRVVLNWNIEERYYLYQDRIQLTLPSGVTLVERMDSQTVSKDDPLFGQVEVFYDRADIELVLARSSDASDAGQFEVSYQGCWEGGICYPPVTTSVSFSGLTDRSVSQAQSESVQDRLSNRPISEQDQFAQTLSESSLITLLGIFFLAGLALSLTPCVFPMIPILSGIIAGQGHHNSTRHGFILSLIYVLAMAVTYTIAGVIAGLFGANIQAALQAPVVIVVFSAIFVLLSISMFGFYDLQMPSSVQTWLTRNSDNQKGGSYSGVAIMGFLSALIVGPCMAAPLAGALIYIGQTGDPVLGGSALFVMSLGMGVPLILIGTSASKLMPRAGRWMETVKAGFGVVLLLMAVWMLDRIVAPEITMGLVALILIVTAVFMGVLDSHSSDTHGLRKLGKGVGIVLLVYGAALAVGLLAGGQSLVYPLKGIVSSSQAVSQKLNFDVVTTLSQLESKLKDAEQAKRAVMLDYYADWCVSCAELDYVTFADDRVKQTLSMMTLIKVDVTANDEESKKLTQRYQVLGPPTLVFYDGQGNPRPELTLVGVPQPEQLLAMTQQL